MSKNFYTTTTAALKATTANIRQINAKQIKLNGEPIPSKVLDDRGDFVTDRDLWGTSVTTDANGVVHVSHGYLSNPNGEDAWNSEVKSVKDNKAYTTTDASGEPICNIQTEMIRDGSQMFLRTELTSFSGDLSSLTNGYQMFRRTYLTSFSSDLSSLVSGNYMFYSTSLASFGSDLSSLVNGSYMFSDTALTSFSSDLSSLVNGSYMFSNTSLASFSSDLSSLVNGPYMFSNTSLASFYSELSSLVDGSHMFQNTPLATFESDLGSLVDGSYMFQNTSLASFNVDLGSLVHGASMFENSPITSFNGDLSSLDGGNYMFQGTPLTSFESDLGSLVDGSYMFQNTPLATFESDLGSLINGNSMFYNASITSFSGDLSSLVNGSSMFYSCKLTPQSVMYIVESIRNITKEKAKYTSGKIPWVTYNSTTRKHSAPYGFMENGRFIYTRKNFNSLANIIMPSDVGKLTLGIDVTNDSSTIEQQLQTFARGCLFDSWAELKQEFVNKGWTVTFQYGGTTTGITLSEDEQFRGTPVYARLIEVTPEGEEYTEKEKASAEYCTEDGTKYYNIDWGHDVTDYDKYQYFGSLLEACGYYGVIPKKYLEEN